MGSKEASTPEKQFQQLLAALDKTDGRVKNHSFQIASLQNQLQAIQNARVEEAQERKQLVQDNERLQTTIAYLKGRLAKLTVEFYYAQASSASASAMSPHGSEGRRPTPRWSTRHNNNTSSSGSTLMPPPQEEASTPSRVVETLEDRMRYLEEERSTPARRLQDFAPVSQSLSVETRDQLNELDQAHFYDARENITDDSNKIKTEGVDDSFSLEDGMLRAPTAAKST